MPGFELVTFWTRVSSTHKHYTTDSTQVDLYFVSQNQCLNRIHFQLSVSSGKMEQAIEPKLCLHPIAKVLNILQMLGGFPLHVKASSITSSNCQVLKPILFYTVITLSINMFHLMNVLYPDEKPFDFGNYYKGFAISNVDFFVGSLMAFSSSTACFISFFTIHRRSKQIEQICLQMEEVNSEHLNGIFYRGRGKNSLSVTAVLEGT